MSEIKQIEDHKTFWKRSTMEIITFTEGTLADIIQLARKDILSLITTIESQQAEIDKLNMFREDYKKTALERIAYQEQQIESQKEEIENVIDHSAKQDLLITHLKKQLTDQKGITSLAEKELKKLLESANAWEMPLTVKRIESTLSEIERLQNEQT